MTRLASQEPAPDIYLWPETATPLEANWKHSHSQGRLLNDWFFSRGAWEALAHGQHEGSRREDFLEPDESADPGPDGGLPLLKESSKLKRLGSGFSVLHAPPLVQSASDSRDSKSMLVPSLTPRVLWTFLSVIIVNSNLGSRQSFGSASFTTEFSMLLLKMAFLINFTPSSS